MCRKIQTPIRSGMGIWHALIIGVVVISFGCGSTSGPKPTAKLEDIVAKETGAGQEIRKINEQLFASIGSVPNVRDYVLGEGDLLQVSVFEAPDLKAEARVSTRGAISLPLLGTTEVKGLTTREAEQKIEDLYKAAYLRDPHVSVFVREQVAGKITLLGALKKPGTYPYLTRQSVFEALATAEGLADNAGRMVQVRRQGEDPEHPSTFIIDLDEVIKKGGKEINLAIRAGDVIYVPEAGTVYVDGAVRKPGNYPVKQKMGIQEAVVAAGGLAVAADQGDIRLVRDAGEGKREVVAFSLKDIQGEKAQDITVKDKDVIFVETSSLKSLFYGLRLNLGAGLLGVGYSPPTTQQ